MVYTSEILNALNYPVPKQCYQVSVDVKVGDLTTLTWYCYADEEFLKALSDAAIELKKKKSN
jgi:hypothetical protein